MKNKVAYITGGTKGIGLGIAKKMLPLGIRVAISGRTLSSAEKVAKELTEKYGGEVLAIESDVKDFENEKQAIENIVAKWGQLDYVIANAGVGHFASIQEMTTQQWNDTIDINLTGVFHTTKASLDALIASKGYLITIASLAGTNFFARGAAYNASKFGLVGFSQAVMMDVRDKEVKVTTIMPGSVATTFNGNVVAEKDNWKIQPEDIGQLVVDLIQMEPRVLPSKVEVRPSVPRKK
jgi:NADP-dependent 3-hydroxy acid dehydrogenase YdfG